VQVCALCGNNLAGPGDTELTPNQAAVPFDEGLKWETLIDSAPQAPTQPPDPPVALPVALLARIQEAGANPPAPPAAGTRCLVLYGADKQPLHYFPVDKDVTLIGRHDPVHGCFPNINLADWLDQSSTRKISRKHAVVLHSRAGDGFFVRPLAGNTGTQIEQEMVEALKDYPLFPGTRLILGGAARFKFEIIS
jgi:hypothetical protein